MACGVVFPISSRFRLSRTSAILLMLSVALLGGLVLACDTPSHIGLLCEIDKDCGGGLKCLNRQCSRPNEPQTPFGLAQICAAPKASESQNCFLHKNNYCCVFQSADFPTRGCYAVRHDLSPPEGRCLCKSDLDCPKPMKCCELNPKSPDKGFLTCTLPTADNQCPAPTATCKAPEIKTGDDPDTKLDCHDPANNYCCSIHQTNGSCQEFSIEGKPRKRCSCVLSSDCPNGMVCCPTDPQKLANSRYFCAIPDEQGKCSNARNFCSLADKTRQDCTANPYCCTPTGKGSCNEFRAFNFFFGKQIKRCSCEQDTDCPQNTFCCPSSLGNKFCSADVKDSKDCAGSCSKPTTSLDCSIPGNFYCCGKINEACINIETQGKEEFRCSCKADPDCPQGLRCCRKGIYLFCTDTCP